ncbi:MAG: hypothetical protein DHS20C18_18990 [Saprospiraceae bacterium]|nr:MAG: hypothetical protein DHS20C18_18990 [Saprospiraceae bacterium]
MSLGKTFFALVFVLLFAGFSTAQDALNVALYAQFNRGDVRYSGSWVYVDGEGQEYALLGAQTGTAIYQINDNESVTEVGFIAGPQTNWREITVVGDHAYVATDVQGNNHGMQVISLTNLPNSASLVTTYTETFTKGHIIQRDIFSEAPYVYVCGTGPNDGVRIMDVSIPASPQEIGYYDPGYYIHDCHVRGDILFGAAFYESTIDIVDISDKSTPVLLSQILVPGGSVHSSSMTEDGHYLFVAPEQDGLPARVFNIEDLENPYEVAQYTANLASLVHNPYIVGDFAFISHNTEGLRVVDISDPEVPVEVGYYDTWADASGGFHGLWSACPYLPSGKIVGGNREDGLYVWTFNGERAGRFYGEVTDAVTELPILSANIAVNPIGQNLIPDLEGKFSSGALPGDFNLTISAMGYISQEISFSLHAGDQLQFQIALVPISSSTTSLSNHDVHLFPNPFGESLQLHGELSGLLTLSLFDESGRLVYQKNHLTLPEEIPFGEQLPAGIYTYTLVDQEGRVASGKVVKGR